MRSRIEANNNSISQYVGSLLFFYRMLLSIDANISSSTTSRDTQFVVAFPFAHNFYSSVTMQLLGSAPSGHMLDSFGCLLPLKLVTYSATQHPIYSITREDKLVGAFNRLVNPNDISLYSINCGASAISRGKTPLYQTIHLRYSLLSLMKSIPQKRILTWSYCHLCWSCVVGCAVLRVPYPLWCIKSLQIVQVECLRLPWTW